jgi:hypothetical protein
VLLFVDSDFVVGKVAGLNEVAELDWVGKNLIFGYHFLL